MPYFKYSKKHIEFLSNKDAVLGAAIEKIGRLKRPVEGYFFSVFVLTVISQQISTKVAESLFKKLKARFNPFNVGTFAALDLYDLNACGISKTKSECILSAAKAISDGKLNLDILSSLDDSIFINEITKIKGAGIWTAQMLSIFALNKLNVLCDCDFGIKLALKALFNVEPTRDFIAKKREIWSPYCSIVSIYLWEIADRVKRKIW